MKGDTKQPFYISAYRLKTLEKAVSSSVEATQSPYLKAMLSGKSKTMSRIRVSPMLNPYKEKHAASLISNKRTEPTKESVHLNEKNWFHNYE